ncbi:unnamed protein product, partial [Brenthis ino]
MYNDLRQLREGAEMILKTALDESNVIDNFVFVPFHDPSVGPVTVTRNKQVFKSALNIVHVYGGGDCPEKSLTGIQLALNVSRPQSFIYVFTDATASDHKLVGKVLDSIQRKQSQVVFVLTGHCNDLHKPHYKVYQQIAAASSGQVFNLNKTSVYKVLEFVRSSIKGRTVNLASAVNPAGYNYTQEIPVDKSVDEVTVSVSGAKPKIKVVNPSGEELTGPPQLVTTLDLSEIMIVKVLQPEPGNWSITVGSEEEHSVKVVGMSNLTFKHGFSVQTPRSMDETSYRPLQGTYNHMLISLSENNASIEMDHVQLLSLNGTPLYEIPLKEFDKDQKLYIANAFVPPEEFFNIAIIGRDEHGQEVRRVGPTAVQGKPPDVPYLTVAKRIEARRHERVSLACRVESLVPLAAAWTRRQLRLAPAVDSLQSTSIEYVIPDMSEGDVGTYRCFAKNSAGVSRANTIVDLIVDPPTVTISPTNITVTEGENLNISCSIYSEALLQRSVVTFNGSTRNYSIDFQLEPTVDGYYTFNKTIQQVNETDSGVYTCEVANRAGKSFHSTYIQVQLKPTAQLIGPHSIAISIHKDTQVVCQIENALQVQWLNKNKQIIEKYDVDGSFTAVLDVRNVTEDEVLTCMAIRDDCNASDSLELTALIKPQVLIEGSKNVTVFSGIQYQVFCTIVAKPEPRIIWHMETEEFLPCDTTNPEPNVYKSMLTLDSEKRALNGTYFCIGENSEGIGQDSITINVRDKMMLLEGFTDSSVELYSQIDFHCNITSFPPPTIKWYHNNTEINNINGSNTKNINISEDKVILNIQKVDFEKLGEYKCVGENGYENITVKGILSLHGLSKPILFKQLTKITVPKDKSMNITCRILRGSPNPTLTWYFKSKTFNNYTTLPKEVVIRDNVIFIENITKEHSGSYRCVADNIMGSDEYDVELTVQYTPELKENSQEAYLEGPIEVTSGGEVKLSCNVAGNPPPIVTWTKDDLPIVFSNNIHITNDSSLVVTNATKFDSGLFVCNASSIMGFVTKNFTVAVFMSPIITIYGEPAVEVLEGQLVELPCSARGVPDPTVRWVHNGESLAPYRKYIDEYGLGFVANLTDFGNYSCVASNEYGVATRNYTVYVWVPPRIEPPLEELKEVKIGTDVHLQCDAVGFPIPSFFWEFQYEVLKQNTTDMSFDETGNLYIKNSSSTHEGIYVCAAENLAGIARKTFFLTVNEAPKILNDNYTSPYIASTLDDTLIVTCRATGKPRPYVTWIKDGYYLDKDSRYNIDVDGTLTIKQPSEDLSGKYTCVARSSAGNDSKDVDVEIYSLPTLLQDEGSPAVTTALEGAAAAVQCPVRNGYTVKWYKDAKVISNGSLIISNVSRHNESQYACVASNAVGSVHTNVMLKVEWPPKFISQVNETVDIVKGEDYYFDCKTDAKPRAKTRWYFNSKFLFGEDKEVLKLMNVQIKHTGVYKCVVKNEHGTVFKQFNVDVLEPPFISEFNLLDVQLKSGTNATLECEARGSPKPNVTWTFNNTNWIVQNATITTTNVTQQSEGLFQCGASNKAGVSRIVYRVVVISGAKIEEILLFMDGTGIHVEEKAELTLGTKVRIACKGSGSPPPIIQWIRYGNTVSENDKGVGYADLVLPDVRTYDSGEYTCVASNEGGTHDKKISVNVLEPPRIFQTLLQNANHSENIIDLEVISGQAFYLHCHPYGNPFPEIYWFKDGLPLRFYDESMVSTDFGEVVHSKNAMYEQSGNYTCVARNKVGEASVVYLVDVLVPPPPLKDNTKQATALVNTPLNMSCPAPRSPAPAALWLKHPYTEIAENSRIKLLDDNYTLLITKTEVADSGKYSCIMTNKVGTTELIYDVVIQKPPEIKGNNGNNTIEDHIVSLRRSIVLKCEVDGNPPPNITWFKDVQALSRSHPDIQWVAGAGALALWAARARHAAQYVCVAENAAGAAHRRYNVRVKVPGKWSAWSPWSYCNATCGLGYQRRARRCQYVDDDNNVIDKINQPDKIILDESECKGVAIDRRKCHMPSCEEAPRPRWSRWSAWGACSASCGAATQARARRCRRAPCAGDALQIRKCQGLPQCRYQRKQTSDEYNEGDVEDVEENIIKENNLDYLPEATFEMDPEGNHPEHTDSVNDFYIPPEWPQTVYYDVNVTSNLDGSERGPCAPGYSRAGDTCHDIDECVIDNNECHLTQVCVNTYGGYRCSCPPGYTSLGAGKRCLDINECQQDLHGCEFACVNVAGGYVCACPPHLRLHADKHHCVTPPLYRKPISYEDLVDEEYHSTSMESSTKGDIK